MHRDITSQLKNLRTNAVNPRTEWVRRNREQLLSQIKNTVPTTAPLSPFEHILSTISIFVSKQLVYAMMRPVAFVLVIAITLTSAYTGTVKASYEALPGDTLYPAKRLVENIPVTVASLVGDTSTETKLRSENAKQRAVEVTKLLQTDDPAKIDKAVQTVTDLKNEIVTISAKLEASTSTDSGIGANTVKEVKDTTDQIKNVLSDVKTDLLISGTSTVVTLAQDVTDAKNLAKDMSLKAVEVIVAKHLDGDSSVSKDAVTQMISSTLQSVVSDANQSKQTIDTTKGLVDAVKIEVKDLAGGVNKQTDPVLASTTKQISDQLNSVSTLANAAASQTQVVSDAVDKKASEAQTSLGNGDLLSAVNAIRQVNTVSKEVEKISDAAIQSTQNVLPVVQVIKDAAAASTSTAQLLNAVSSTPAVSSSSLDILRVVLNSSTVNTTTSVVNPLTSTTPKAVTGTVQTTTDDKSKK